MPKIVAVNLDFENADFEAEMAAKAGIEFANFPEADPDSIIERLADADGAITSYGNFPRKVFESLPNLKVVSRTGVGYEQIDVEAATDCGVAVCTPPGYANEVVSDHAITLALCVLRRVVDVDRDFRAGVWNYALHKPFGQCAGRTFGVVGMGGIGKAVARKAAGLGFKVVCWSRSLAAGSKTAEGYEVLELDELLSQVDVVSFHTALTDDTYHLLNDKRIALMKPGAVVVNTSRGEVIDTTALAHALEEGRLWGAGIDVFEGEPVDMTSPIVHAPRTVLTSHCAYWSEESGVELRSRTMQAVIDVVSSRKPADCLNPQVLG